MSQPSRNNGETLPLLSTKTEDGSAAVTLPTETPTILEEITDIVQLAVPIFVSRLSFVGMKTTDSALLGHVSREALSASALSDLWTMCSQVLLGGQILGVLVGGAVGAGNPKLAGIYLQVSYVVLSILAVFVFVAWNFTEQVWLAFGSDPEISKMAGYYATVLSLGIPGIVIFGQLSQYFCAQRIMTPAVMSSSMGLVMNLVLGLVFVLGWPIPNFHGYQFAACPIVTMCVTYTSLITMLIVYVHFQKLHLPTWGGWDWKEITWDRIKTYIDLYVPAALASASDFWRMAVIGAFAARMGEEEVAVFNTSYRIMWITLIVIGSIAGASAINMTLRLGNMNPYGARQAGYVGIALSAVILVLLGGFILVDSRLVARIFTEDEIFLSMFQEASIPFTLTLCFMNLAVAIERVPYSMGRTREILWMGFIGSWFGQVPGVIIMTRYWSNDLKGLYAGMAIGYAILCALYGWITIQR